MALAAEPLTHEIHPPPLTRPSILTAHAIIKPHIHLTPILTSSTLNAIASTPQSPEALKGTQYAGRTPAKPVIRFHFKCENLQRIGAFKARGAFHALSCLEEGVRRRGVVTHSSGNHAQAVALACKHFNTKAHIIMPSTSASTKIAATKALGATVHFSGPTSAEREEVTVGVLASLAPGTVVLHPYDDNYVICGQGTTALEMQEQTKDAGVQLDGVIAPCGGGGLLSGVAIALSGSGIKVFGAEPSYQGADDARRGLAAGKRIEFVKSATIADGLRTPLGTRNWGIISNPEMVKRVYSVSEAQIKSALRLVLERMKVVVEPSAVVGLAVALYDEAFRGMVEREGGENGWDLGVVFTGGNTSVEFLSGLYAD